MENPKLPDTPKLAPLKAECVGALEAEGTVAVDTETRLVDNKLRSEL